MLRICTVCVVALALVLPSAAAGAEKSDFASAWTGISAGPQSVYYFAGAAYAIGGDLDRDGLVARIGFGGGEYRTDGSDPQDVVNYGADLMLGYRVQWSDAAVMLYAGGDFREHDNHDPGADIQGAELGIKALVEVYAPLSDAFYVSAFGSYSTAFDSFNASARLAYRLTDRIAVGPETAALGSQGFDQARTGIAAAYWIGEKTELAASAGYAWSMNGGDGGIYGVINLYTRF